MKKIILCDCGAINRVDSEKLNTSTPVCGKCSRELDTSPSLKSISDTKLEKIIQNADLPVIVDAYADWCGPCKMYGPIFEGVSKQKSNEAEFFKIDTEKNAMFSVKYGIRGIPTTLVFYKGKLIKNQSGLLQKEHIEALLADVQRG